MQGPVLSIICVSVRPHFLLSLFESLSHNKYPFELVVVGCEAPKTLPIIQNIVSEECHAKRCAMGVDAANGKYIFFTSDDFTFDPGSIDNLQDFFINVVDKRKALVTGIDYTVSQTATGFEYEDVTYKHFLYGTGPLIVTTVGIRKEYFLELGGIDKRFTGCEWEKDFCLRAYADGAFPAVCYNTKMYGHHYRHLQKSGKTLKVTHPAGVGVMRDLWYEGETLLKERRHPVAPYTREDLIYAIH